MIQPSDKIRIEVQQLASCIQAAPAFHFNQVFTEINNNIKVIKEMYKDIYDGVLPNYPLTKAENSYIKSSLLHLAGQGYQTEFDVYLTKAAMKSVDIEFRDQGFKKSCQVITVWTLEMYKACLENNLFKEPEPDKKQKSRPTQSFQKNKF